MAGKNKDASNKMMAESMNAMVNSMPSLVVLTVGLRGLTRDMAITWLENNIKSHTLDRYDTYIRLGGVTIGGFYHESITIYFDRERNRVEKIQFGTNMHTEYGDFTIGCYSILS